MHHKVCVWMAWGRIQDNAMSSKKWENWSNGDGMCTDHDNIVPKFSEPFYCRWSGMVWRLYLNEYGIILDCYRAEIVNKWTELKKLVQVYGNQFNTFLITDGIIGQGSCSTIWFHVLFYIGIFKRWNNSMLLGSCNFWI